jgi:glutamine cyclotransferase
MKTLSSQMEASRAERPRSPAIWMAMFGLLFTCLAALPFLAPKLSPEARAPQAQPPRIEAPAQDVNRQPVRRLKWRVVRTIPHDRQAFLQGLLWDQGGFYESTGLEGESTLRRLSYPSGRVEVKRNLPQDVFGEGLVAWKDRLIQITWKSNKAFVWDKKSLLPRREFSYEGEGWGITSSGKQLIMSNGSSMLTFRDPESFTVQRTVQVTLEGRPVPRLNELEYIGGLVWANVWQTNLIVCIHPRTGQVRAVLDLSDILPASQRTGQEDVLNGIAHDPQTGRIWVSGKLWPSIFEIAVS